MSGAVLNLRDAPPYGWRWVDAPEGYARSLGAPPFARWAQSLNQPQSFACTTADSFRWLSVVEAEQEGWIVKDDSWMRFVRLRLGLAS